MKQYFYFYFDNGGTLCCVNEYMYQEHHYKDNQALKFLNITNHLNFKKIILKDNSMYLKSNNNSVIINDIDTFWRKKYYHFLPNVKAILDNSLRYNLLKDNNYSGMSVDNMTIMAKPYKQKIAIKGGSVVLYAGAFLTLSSLLSNNIDKTINIQKKDITSIDNNVSDRIINPETIEKEKEYINVYIENEKAKQEEYNKKMYYNFTSYNDDTKDAYDNYYNIVYNEAKRWGLDPNLVMAMMIQESRGQQSNLMQISYSSWDNHEFECYDFIDQEYKKITLTDLDTPEGNVRAGCIILRYSIMRNNNNIMAGVQNYNLGDGNMDKVLKATCEGENKTKEELLSNQDDLSFTNYTKYASGGDKYYISNVSRHLNETDYIYFMDIDDNGNITEYKHNLVKESEKILIIDK